MGPAGGGRSGQLILVTGGTGTLGRQLVPRLQQAGHRVRVMSRRVSADTVKGDLTTGEGLDTAVAGVEVVVHAATNPVRPKRTDVRGTARLIDAVGAVGSAPHLLYVSIVGVDRHPFPYYRAKWGAEQLVEASALPWTIFRAVQFHDLLDRAFRSMRPVLVAPRGFRFQLLDTGEAAGRIVELVGAGPGGRAAEMGGPEVLDMGDIARTWKRARGSRKPVMRPPVPGRIGRAFREGVHLAPDHADGTVTWEQWLANG